MQLLAPDILAEARGLTPAMSGTLCTLGITLWLFGWRWHRFWIVAGVSLGAGLFGLEAGRGTGGTQVLAVGLLLAVCAGMLALELARLFAFAAGGCGAWLVLQWVLPQAQELWATFLCGGLLGLLLYRLWTMLLTSLLGVLLAAHAGLVLLEPLVGFDAAAWAVGNQALGNGIVVGATVLGIFLQAVASPEGSDERTSRERSERQPGTQRSQERGVPDDRCDRPGGSDTQKPLSWWRRLLGQGPRSFR